MPLSILQDHPAWVAIDKPAGRLVIPGRTGGELSLRAQLEEERGEKLFVVHRLDRDTTGVLLFARTAETHRLLSMAFEAGRLQKHYLALVEGAWGEDVTIAIPLLSARKGRMRAARAEEDGKVALTRFRVLDRFGVSATWMEAIPLTGRTHQIRVHASAVGHPLLVDPQYGARAEWRLGSAFLDRTPLHASQLRIPVGLGLEPAVVTAPLPADLRAILDALAQSSSSIR